MTELFEMDANEDIGKRACVMSGKDLIQLMNQALMNLLNGIAGNDMLEEHALRCFGRNFARGRFDCAN